MLLAKKSNRNKIIHDKILQETANITPVIMQMDLCTMWGVSQWIEERKVELGRTNTHGDNQKFLRAHKDWAFRNKKKAKAGMLHSRVTPFSPLRWVAWLVLIRARAFEFSL